MKKIGQFGFFRKNFLNVIIPETFKAERRDFYSCALFVHIFLADPFAAADNGTDASFLQQTNELISESEFALDHNHWFAQRANKGKNGVCVILDCFGGSLGINCREVYVDDFSQLPRCGKLVIAPLIAGMVGKIDKNTQMFILSYLGL